MSKLVHSVEVACILLLQAVLLQMSWEATKCDVNFEKSSGVIQGLLVLDKAVDTIKNRISRRLSKDDILATM